MNSQTREAGLLLPGCDELGSALLGFYKSFAANITDNRSEVRRQRHYMQKNVCLFVKRNNVMYDVVALDENEESPILLCRTNAPKEQPQASGQIELGPLFSTDSFWLRSSRSGILSRTTHLVNVFNNANQIAIGVHTSEAN